MDRWENLTNTLLSKNHIKIPIEKRFFLSFLDSENDTENINKQKIISELDRCGFLQNDPRLLKFRNNLKILVKTKSINFSEFKHCVENNILILGKILRKELIIPNFVEFCSEITDIYNKTKDYNYGENASYIPQLKKVDSNQYGISVCTIDGQRFNIGDTNVYYSIQSCCKPINYGIAMEEIGEENVHKFVGREPSGQSFNELTLNKEGKPHNPLINSGAIMTSSLIKNNCESSERFEHVMDIWSRLSGGIEKIGFNNPVYLSEKNTADRNYALAYFMKEKNHVKKIGFPDNTNLHETMELYFQCCSIEVNTQIMSIVAATLANGGVNPFTNERIWSSSIVKNVLSMMLMCGMYDYSGEFAFKIGIPAKSGVAGAVMIVIPNVMGIVTWSPKLDEIGNSARGIEFCKLFGEKFNFHIFDSLNDESKINPLQDKYNDNKNNEFSELCLSAKEGDLENIRKLFNLSVDMSQSDYDGRTALHLACCENNLEIVRFLINVAKVKKFPKDRWGKTPLDEAKEKGFKEITELF